MHRVVGPGEYHIDRISKNSPWKHLKYGGRTLQSNGAVRT